MNIALPRALIAEDEPLLAAALQRDLAQAWPELQVVASVGDGLSAVREALALRPDVLFFDIRMPGQSGLDAAAELADAWPGDTLFPALVFLTAYDQYAVQAFEAQAADYLLKPLQRERLLKTVARLKQRLAAPRPVTRLAEGALLTQLRALLAAESDQTLGAKRATEPLRVIQASQGNRIHMVPVDDVLVFEAADKYVRVLTAEQEHLIRTPLKELTAQLDSRVFWQIHRSVLVRASAIAAATRDEGGRLHLELAGRTERWAVSRLYAHLFKAM